MTKTAASGITSRRRGRSLGPGNRIPAFIISPFAKDGIVDHTQ
ncbi:alkaline phosphatase family protein [Rhizobium sp. 268]